MKAYEFGTGIEANRWRIMGAAALAAQLSQLKAIQSVGFGGGSWWRRRRWRCTEVGRCRRQEQQQQPLTPAFC